MQELHPTPLTVTEHSPASLTAMQYWLKFHHNHIQLLVSAEVVTRITKKAMKLKAAACIIVGIVQDDKLFLCACVVF